METLLTKKTFQCDRYCGECCKKLLVRVSKQDIERIKKLGYKEEHFLLEDPFNIMKIKDFQDTGNLRFPREKKFFLKKDEKGWCVFLKKSKDGKYSCSIHENRPKICRQYPFFGKTREIKSCLPEDMHPNVFFSFSSKNNQ